MSTATGNRFHPPVTAGLGVDCNMSCGEQPCEGMPAAINCREAVKSADVELDLAKAFTLAGDTVTLRLDFTSPALARFAAAHAPGTTLTTRHAGASISPSSLSFDACSGSSCVSPFVDGAIGQDFTLPSGA